MAKDSRLVEPSREGCYSYKESSLQGLDSEEIRIFSLHALYAEERKTTALTVKKSKIQSWEKFVPKMHSNCCQTSKVFWEVVMLLRGKIYYISAYTKDI